MATTGYSGSSVEVQNVSILLKTGLIDNSERITVYYLRKQPGDIQECLTRGRTLFYGFEGLCFQHKVMVSEFRQGGG